VEKYDNDNDNFKMITIPWTFETSADDNIKNNVFQKFRMVLKHYIFERKGFISTNIR